MRGAKSGFSPTRAFERGMSLIEILIVLALIALVTGAMLSGTGLLGSAEQRAAASLMVSAVRKGLAVANATGKPTRLAIDLETSRVVLEQSSSVLAVRSAPLTGEKLVQSAEAEALAEGEEITSGMRKHRPSFLPVEALGQDGDLPGRFLGRNVKVGLVHTEHDEEPVTEGQAYLYFWPGGVTERAVVQLAQGTHEGLTVTVSPLTGRARIERGKVPLPEGRFGEDFSEREEL
jgi:general secretion pathway protein H